MSPILSLSLFSKGRIPHEGNVRFRDRISRLRGRNNEGIIALVIVGIVAGVGSFEPSFWNIGTIYNIAYNSFVPLTFALGVLLILIFGGIDVSFDAIGIFSGYAVAQLITAHVLPGSVWLACVCAAAIGLLLGSINAVLVAVLHLPTLIVTLGTRGLFTGVMLTFVGSNFINQLGSSFTAFGGTNLVSTTLNGRNVGLQVLIIPVVIACMLVALGLRYLLIGRGLYAIGGNEESARRVGFPVGRIKLLAFVASGALAGLAGMMHIGLNGVADPQDLVGSELTVIAAVVIGGASIFGGRGSVIGTVLGVVLIELIQYCLVIVGLPSSWDNVAVGILLLIGMTLQAASFSSNHRRRRLVALDATSAESSREGAVV